MMISQQEMPAKYPIRDIDSHEFTACLWAFIIISKKQPLHYKAPSPELLDGNDYMATGRVALAEHDKVL